jgi:general secretion pathway protein C
MKEFQQADCRQVLNHNPRMSSRWTGFFIWALVAASAAFWSLQIFAATRPVPPGAQAPQAGAANGPMERLFGAVAVPTVVTAAAAPESSRFKLVGVIAPPDGVSGNGFAVVQIDDAPARTWRVGATLDGNTSLLAVSKRGADFGPTGGPSSFALQLPEPAAAETGSLQPAVSQPDAAQNQLRAAMQPQMPMPPQVQQPGRPGMQGRLPGRGGFANPPGGVAPPQAPTQAEQPADGQAPQQ